MEAIFDDTVATGLTIVLESEGASYTYFVHEGNATFV